MLAPMVASSTTLGDVGVDPEPCEVAAVPASLRERQPAVAARARDPTTKVARSFERIMVASG
jgi:hypothetical protein